MPAKKITDAFCRTVRPPQKPKQDAYIDTMETGLGLMLIVSYGGAKTFRVLTYDHAGRQQTKKLGRYPQMTVKQARKKAREYFENPDECEEEAESGSFKEVAEEFFKKHVESNLRSANEIERQLKTYVYPKWAKAPFVKIKRREVSKLLDEIEHKNGRVQADAVLATLRKMMGWYEGRSNFYKSPIVKAMKRDQRTAEEKERDRVLDDDEIKAVWEACDQLGGRFAGIVKLCLLTGQRRSKVVAIKWPDIDDDGVWTIATEDREKGNAGCVRLPDMAIDVINEQPRIAENEHVFAAHTIKTKNGHFNSWGECKAELDRLLPDDMPEWRIHDLRRTARTLMARAGVPDHVAELAVGHKQIGMGKIYNRYDYLDEKSDALARVASLIGKILNPPPANVIDMKNRSKGAKK